MKEFLRTYVLSTSGIKSVLVTFLVSYLSALSIINDIDADVLDDNDADSTNFRNSENFPVAAL